MAQSPVTLINHAASAPTTNFHQAGEVVLSSVPAIGGIVGWVCTADGTPGTWAPIDSIPQSVTYNKTVTITAAEIAALRATPKVLVAAPGAGKMLEFVSAELFLDYTAPGFTESVDNLAVKYTDGSGVAASQAIEMTGFIDQTADTKTNALAKIDVIAAKTACENKALVLHNTGDGEFGNSGGSSIRMNITYRVHTTGW